MNDRSTLLLPDDALAIPMAIVCGLKVNNQKILSENYNSTGTFSTWSTNPSRAGMTSGVP